MDSNTSSQWKGTKFLSRADCYIGCVPECRGSGQWKGTTMQFLPTGRLGFLRSGDRHGNRARALELSHRVLLTVVTILSGFAWTVAFPAVAQTYPSKAVRVIVPFVPGGSSDISARQFSAKLSQAFGQQFVIDNRGGAGGMIGMELTAKAPPDGYTLMMCGGIAAVAAWQKPAWDPINAIVPVAEFGITPSILTVHPSLPVATTKELIGLARAKPGQIAFASTGIGGVTHLATELFVNMAKIRLLHVPYKGTGAAMSDLLSGQVPFIVGGLLGVVRYIEIGKLRGLAVTTTDRWYSLPDLPTVAETVPGYEFVQAFGTMAPRGTPQPIIAALNAALNKALDQPEMKKNLEAQGMAPTGGSAQQYGERTRKEYDRWVKLLTEVDIKAD